MAAAPPGSATTRRTRHSARCASRVFSGSISSMITSRLPWNNLRNLAEPYSCQMKNATQSAGTPMSTYRTGHLPRASMTPERPHPMARAKTTTLTRKIRMASERCLSDALARQALLTATTALATRIAMTTVAAGAR